MAISTISTCSELTEWGCISILGSIGIWTGFDFAEERERVRGTVDGDLKHKRQEKEEFVT